MNIRKELERIIDTKGLTDDQLRRLWRQWTRRKPA
jgi:hypothetical protein